jgi:hypothetical protein
MNLLSFRQGRATRILRQRVETMEVLVKVVKRDAKVSENRLRAAIARARDEIDRPPRSSALAWRQAKMDRAMFAARPCCRTSPHLATEAPVRP